MNLTNVDFIGDIHGHAQELTQLFQKLGYENANGYFHHSDRKAFFVGDFIDRGPQIKEVIDIVRPMIDNGAAYTVIGNHEYNAICYWTKVSGHFLRDHSEKNTGQHQKTINSFTDVQLRDCVNWFKTLPIYFECDGFRVIHAQWHQTYIDQLRTLDVNNFSNPEFLATTANKATPAYRMIDVLLKGEELQVPNVFFRDKDLNERDFYRLKWWMAGNNVKAQDALFEFEEREKDIKLPELSGYDPNDVPVFFGHYWLKDKKPILQQKNVCCLDFSIAKGGILTAYRWDGERELDVNKFLWVE